MHNLMICISSAVLTSASFFNMGKFFGAKEASAETRTQVVFYCNERPSECKEEYNVLRTKRKLSKFQLPELVLKK